MSDYTFFTGIYIPINKITKLMFIQFKTNFHVVFLTTSCVSDNKFLTTSLVSDN